MILKAEKINKSFKSGNSKLHVLKDIDLEVDLGDFLIISGRSGAGKSTLLYQLGLLDQPNSGEIYLLGQKTRTLGYRERTRIRLENLGYVFQYYALIPELTALENVALPVMMIGKSKKEAYPRAMKILDKFGLKERMNNLPSQLSGGEQQRVAIARAIVNNAQIIFADEPTANLDSANAKMIMESFKDLSSQGQTIVMVSHEEQYYNFANRVIYLDDGRIAKEK
jgi:putative ABC transport system ATP-binding protein